MPIEDHAENSHVVRGQPLPTFTLPGADGMPHSLEDYKQLQHLLMVIVSNSMSGESTSLLSLLHTFAQHYADFRAEQCALLAITPHPVIVNLRTQEELHLPFPLVSDTQGKVIANYTRLEAATHTCSPALVLMQRDGTLYESWATGESARLPTIQQLINTVAKLNRQG